MVGMTFSSLLRPRSNPAAPERPGSLGETGIENQVARVSKWSGGRSREISLMTFSCLMAR